MNTKTTLPITEARKRIFDIAEQVQKPGVIYTFTEKGKPKAVMMSAEEYESWAETLEVMQDFPDLKKDIEETDRAIKSGEYKKWPTLDGLLAKEGYVLKDKAGRKYASIKTQAKGGKRSPKTAKGD